MLLLTDVMSFFASGIVWHFFYEKGACLFVFLENQFRSGWFYHIFSGGLCNALSLAYYHFYNFLAFLSEKFDTLSEILAYFW